MATMRVTPAPSYPLTTTAQWRRQPWAQPKKMSLRPPRRETSVIFVNENENGEKRENSKFVNENEKMMITKTRK